MVTMQAELKQSQLPRLQHTTVLAKFVEHGVAAPPTAPPQLHKYVCHRL